MAKLPDPTKNEVPPNAAKVKELITEATARLNMIPDRELDIAHAFGLIMAYGGLFSVLESFNRVGDE